MDVLTTTFKNMFKRLSIYKKNRRMINVIALPYFHVVN